MRIAVIGAGNVGGAFTRAATQGGHTVVVTGTSVERAREVAQQTGATSVLGNAAAVQGADLVVLAVPGSVAGAVAEEIREAAAGVPVVDVTNPLNATYTDLSIAGTSGAGDLQDLLPDSPVVKAFNTIFAARYAAPVEGGRPLPVLIAGDDAGAKAAVSDLATSLGFQSVDVGGLRMARALEEMAFLNISLNATNGWSWQSAWTLAGPSSLG